MSPERKITFVIPIVIILFFGAYARHKFESKQIDITGRLQRKDMNEISGIAASGINDNLYYIHNDSGDTSRFFSILPSGEIKSTIYYNGDQEQPLGVRDCEDIAVGPGPDKEKSYVYVGDIGDNNSTRKDITVYRMAEERQWNRDSISTAKAEPLHLKYPDGPKDAETLMIDPVEKLIYIVSKRQDSVTVYTTPLLYKPNDTLILQKRCKLYFAGYKLFRWITAGDISKDGRQVLLKSYEKVYYWKREGKEPVWKTMQRSAQILPYEAEKQGEAIGFTPDGKGYYTTSEGVYSPIYYYKVPQK